MLPVEQPRQPRAGPTSGPGGGSSGPGGGQASAGAGSGGSRGADGMPTRNRMNQMKPNMAKDFMGPKMGELCKFIQILIFFVK